MQSDRPETPDAAPHPWRIEEPNKHYFRIVDAAGRPVCDFFPEAAWTRGRAATLDIAHRIVRLANSAALHGDRLGNRLDDRDRQPVFPEEAGPEAPTVTPRGYRAK